MEHSLTVYRLVNRSAGPGRMGSYSEMLSQAGLIKSPAAILCHLNDVYASSRIGAACGFIPFKNIPDFLQGAHGTFT
jgi:hypothetical protein